MTPQRIQLSRKKGFDLQKVSMELNGLPAVNCSRPGYFGNPFKVCDDRPAGKAVAMFMALVESGQCKNLPFPDRPAVGWKIQLHGKNLACWCKLSAPCHCDYLLAKVNGNTLPKGYLTEIP